MRGFSANNQITVTVKAVKIDLQDVSETRKTLAVTLEASEVDAEEKELVKEFQGMAKVPGFRPGKAPTQVVKKRYAKQVESELQQRVMSKAYRDGSKEAKIDLINIVDVDKGSIAPGQEATISFTVDVRPQFEIKDYKGLEVEGAPETVSDEEIDEMIDHLRRDRAEFQPTDRASQAGDYVKFSHEGSIDGQPIAEIAPEKPVYGKMPQTWEEVGTEQGLIPGLSPQLAGLKKGDKKEVKVEFPEDFSVEELRGRKAVYQVEVLEVRERKLPEMDQAFFEQQGVTDLEGLKERIKSYLETQKRQRRRSDIRRQISEKLASSVQFGLPESLVDMETEQAMRQIVSQSVQQGTKQEELEANKEAIHANARQQAEGRVKLQLILSEIAKQEKIELTDDDFSRYVMNQAYQSGQKPQAIVNELKKDQDRLSQTRQSLLLDKTLEFLADQAKVSEVEGKKAEA